MADESSPLNLSGTFQSNKKRTYVELVVSADRPMTAQNILDAVVDLLMAEFQPVPESWEVQEKPGKLHS